MNNNESTTKANDSTDGHPQQGPFVEIFINNNPYQIHRGHESVAEIKAVAQVPAAFELELVGKDGLEDLPDDGAVTIKGGEKFIAHPRSGQVS